MRKPINPRELEQIDAEFSAWMACTECVSNDGIISMKHYEAAPLRILWVLKQNIDYGQYDYAKHVSDNRDGICSSPTWRRMAAASHGLLTGIRDFEAVRTSSKEDRIDSFLSTAIINANKETGESRSPDSIILAGYEKYRNIIARQIAAYDPDVVIVGMCGTNERLKPIVASIYKDLTGATDYVIDGNSAPASANVAWSRANGRAFLWTYHPSYSRLTNRDFFDGVVNAFDACRGIGGSKVSGLIPPLRLGGLARDFPTSHPHGVLAQSRKGAKGKQVS